MPLSEQAFHEFEAILGPQNLSRDPCTLTSYAWNNGVGMLPGPKLAKQQPVLVTKPADTASVAAIVKACVLHGLHYKALSSGNGSTYLSRGPDVVVVDLCRMNRMSIDRVNQMAVIEPCVTAGKLQAEAMKLGLTCHIVGAGPTHCPLASATSFGGVGITGSTTGHNNRNGLALEWVSPEGEVVQIGSSASGEWFSEESPGPGFRGMIRGYIGALGALGIFTKMGYKLHPWAGPKVLELTGSPPQMGMHLPETMRFHICAWENWEDMQKATFDLNRSSACFALLKIPPPHVGWTLTETNADYYRLYQNGNLPAAARAENRMAWQIVTVGYSPEEIAWQERVVRHVAAETSGRFLDVAPADAELLTRNIVTSLYVGRVFRGVGSGGTSFGIAESLNLFPGVMRLGEKLVAEETRPGGVFAADLKDGFWSWPTENRTIWAEDMFNAKTTPKGSAIGLRVFLEHLREVTKLPGLGSGFVAGPLVYLYGSRMSHVDVWMRRIKRLFDPRNVADSTMYVSTKKPPALLKLWPLIEAVMLSRFGRPILDRIIPRLVRKGF